MIRLYCFPHAGGTAATFRSWKALLAPDITVVPVQYPGRHELIGETPIETPARMVRHLSERILADADGPYAVLGHSLGATLAHHVTVRLEAIGRPPVHLFVGGRRPHPYVEDMAPLPQDDVALIDALRTLGHPDSAALEDAGLREAVLPSVRADFRLAAAISNVRLPMIGVSVTALAGRGDPGGGPQQLSEWARTTSGSFTLHSFEGGHFFISSDRSAVLDAVRGSLTGAQQHH